ncbi:hypothetical protein ACJJTC_011356 [Scirpophaga incertulas]
MRKPGSPDHSNVTYRSKKPTLNTSPGGHCCVSEERLQSIIALEVSSILKSTIKEQVTTELKNIREQIYSFQDSMAFFNKQFEEIRTALSEKDSLITDLKAENERLKSATSDLTQRLNIVEVHLRESNIEINGIPEHRSENLVDTIIQLGKIVDTPLVRQDIVKVTRVAKLSNNNSRPRAVIAKLCNPRMRDAVLASVTKFNKANAQDKLSSSHLGIGGSKVPIFVAEHLTPGNKMLHAATRRKAKEFSYKFVWIRNGRIYARKDEYSQALLIKSSDSLKLICK